jgi:hypothetical protein
MVVLDARGVADNDLAVVLTSRKLVLVQSEIGVSWNKHGCYLERFYQGRSGS